MLAIAGTAGADETCRLLVAELAELTGLSQRSVKGAIAELTRLGLVAREGPGRLSVRLPAPSPPGGPFPPPRALTGRQEAAIARALREASDLIARDASAEPVPGAERFGLESATTWSAAFGRARSTRDGELGRRLVGELLAWRWGERVEGRTVV